MENDHKEFLAAAHQKFAAYRELSEQSGPEQAWEKMLEGFPEKQKQRMTPFLAASTLAEGFTQAIPFFKSAGMDMQVVDISNRGTDAALEIQKYCPYLDISKEHGFDTPCHVICEMDVEATRRAFPEMNGEILSRQASGSCVCLFKYERSAG
jgi:predicted ArsR family transcriptional regulator